MLRICDNHRNTHNFTFKWNEMKLENNWLPIICMSEKAEGKKEGFIQSSQTKKNQEVSLSKPLPALVFFPLWNNMVWSTLDSKVTSTPGMTKSSGLANIRERIDWGVSSSQWQLLFPDAHITYLPLEESDHSTLLLNTQFTRVKKPKYFMF